MTQPRTYDEVHAEQVAAASQAVANAAAASTRQQADGQTWLTSGLPADATVTQPGPHQHE